MKQLATGSKVEEYVLEEVLGEGAFGRVYKASRVMPDGKETYAIKHICMPSREQYNEMLASKNGDVKATNAYFRDALKDIVAEFSNMRDLSRKNSRYFVNYYDYKIYGTPKEYDVFVRMELMTALNFYLRTHELRIYDVIKIGDNIGRALRICHEKQMVHRDVKESNIFVDDDGDFKLGDFGVATTLEKDQGIVSRKGTPVYMAPEMLLDKQYSFDVDIYALCVVLYKLLNCNRPPFFPPYPNKYDASDVEAARNKKIAGEIPELPINAKNSLGEAIVKGILPVGQRYNTVDEFLDRLLDAAALLDKATLNSVIINPGTNQGNNGSNSLQNSRSVEEGQLHNFGKSSRVDSAEFMKYSKTGTSDTGTYNKNGINNRTNYSENGKQVHKPHKLLYVMPVVGSILLFLILFMLIDDNHFSYDGKPLFFDALVFKLLLLIVSAILILIPIIYIIIYPDIIKALKISFSKDWKHRCKKCLKKMKETVENKTKAQLNREEYKQIVSRIRNIERSVAESKAFAKSTQESLKYEKMAYYELSKLCEYLSNDTVASDVNSTKTLRPNDYNYIDKVLNHIEHFISLRNISLKYKK